MGRLMRMGCAIIASSSASSESAVSVSPSSPNTASLLRITSRTDSPLAAIKATSCSRVGGVLRYSITSGSTPLLRIIASVLREVPHRGCDRS